ncbi:hypothetical protein [Methylobacter sp. S3L5C]|nr:hypothetical protein [Methylobacter sp. S3L5C]
MPKPKVLIFDVNETLLDLTPVIVNVVVASTVKSYSGLFSE